MPAVMSSSPSDLDCSTQDHDAGGRRGGGRRLLLQYHAFSSGAVAAGACVALNYG